MWLADRRVERLTHHVVGRAIMPSISPDGKFVAFAAQTLQRLQFWDFQIHVLELATGKTPRARRARRHLLAVVVAGWKADRERRAAQGTIAAADPRRPPASSRASCAPIPKRWHYYPEWSPDGRWIAFSVSPEHHQGEDWDLAIVAPDGSGYQRLTTGPGNDRLPDWKP